jgi:N,N'-diacetylchitobiose transport system permease protein
MGAATSPRRRVATVLFSALSVVIFVCSVFPVYWMVQTSFQPNNEIIGSDVNFWPETFTLRNYATVFSPEGRAQFLPALGNSLTVTLLTVAVALVFAFLAALAVTRFRFRTRKAFILTILIVQMIPAEAMIVSTFRVLDGWNLLNTIAGLTFVYIATVLPFTIWTLRGFVNGVPIDLEEAGMIDGLSRIGAFWRITFPLLAPGLVATGVFGFIQAWNEFLLALVVTSDHTTMTVPIKLSMMVVGDQYIWGQLMAGAILASVPITILYFIGQRFVVQGLSAGAVKG